MEETKWGYTCKSWVSIPIVFLLFLPLCFITMSCMFVMAWWMFVIWILKRKLSWEMCKLFLSPLLEMGFSYILQFSHLLQLICSRIVKFPLQAEKSRWKREENYQQKKHTCRMLTLKLWSSNVVIIPSSKLWSSQSSLFIFSSVLASCSKRLFLRWKSKIQYLQNWTCYCRGRDTCRPFPGCFQISSPHFSPLLLLASEPSPETH